MYSSAISSINGIRFTVICLQREKRFTGTALILNLADQEFVERNVRPVKKIFVKKGKSHYLLFEKDWMDKMPEVFDDDTSFYAITVYRKDNGFIIDAVEFQK